MLEPIAARIQKGLDRHRLDNSLKFDCGKDGCITIQDGQVWMENRDADCTIGISAANLEKLMTGRLNPMTAFAMGKIKVSGDLSVAMKLSKLFG